MATPALRVLAQPDRASLLNRSILAYVASYSSPQGPEGSKGNGQGIYLFQMDPLTGALSQRELFADDANPSWLALNPAGTHLYAANETSNFQGTNSGSVTAFSIARPSGHLTLLDTVSSGGAGPAHLSVHPSNKYVLVANYARGKCSCTSYRLERRTRAPDGRQRGLGEGWAGACCQPSRWELCHQRPRSSPRAHDPVRSGGSVRSGE
jgi:hypothetical protein